MDESKIIGQAVNVLRPRVELEQELTYDRLFGTCHMGYVVGVRKECVARYFATVMAENGETVHLSAKQFEVLDPVTFEPIRDAMLGMEDESIALFEPLPTKMYRCAEYLENVKTGDVQRLIKDLHLRVLHGEIKAEDFQRHLSSLLTNIANELLK